MLECFLKAIFFNTQRCKNLQSNFTEYFKTVFNIIYIKKDLITEIAFNISLLNTFGFSRKDPW